MPSACPPMRLNGLGTDVASGQFVTRSEQSVKPQLCFLCCRAHPHVRARSVFDNRELASARFARRNAARIKLRYPFVPNRPPRPLTRRGAAEPFVRTGRQLVVRPMAIFGAWRADHASHMARIG